MQFNRYSLTPRGAIAIISVLTFFCFLPDLGNGLLEWDDAGYILENVRIQTLSAETVRWAFTEFCCNFWAPLTWLSLALDYAVWGPNPLGYHLTNNLLHIANACMFFFLSREFFAVYRAGTRPNVGGSVCHDETKVLWCSLLASLFFALHPLRVESVAWATERKDLLSLFFGLPALFAYIRHVRFCRAQPESMARRLHFFVFSPDYWLTFAFFCLSVLSKPMLVTLPVALLILDWFPFRRLPSIGWWRIAAEKVMLLFVSGVVSLISMKATQPSALSLAQSDLFSRTFNAFKSIAAYLWLTLWPVDISPFYVHPGNIAAITAEYASAVIFVIAVTVSCLVLIKRYPFALAVWLLYLVTLLPILGFTQVGPQAMAARFTYAPSLPVSIFVAVLFSMAIFRESASRPATITAGVAVGCILIFYCFVTIRHITFWKDDVTLWTRVIDLNPNATGRAYFQRSHAYSMRGDHRLALADINRALDIAMRKQYRALHEIYQMRAQISAKLGDFEGAIEDYSRALESAGGGERAMLYWARGEIYQRIGDSARAAADFAMGSVR